MPQTVQHSKCSTHASPLEHATILPCFHNISFVRRVDLLVTHASAQAFNAQHALLYELLHMHVHESHTCDLFLKWV